MGTGKKTPCESPGSLRDWGPCSFFPHELHVPRLNWFVMKSWGKKLLQERMRQRETWGSGCPPGTVTRCAPWEIHVDLHPSGFWAPFSGHLGLLPYVQAHSWACFLSQQPLGLLVLTMPLCQVSNVHSLPSSQRCICQGKRIRRYQAHRVLQLLSATPAA